MSLFSFPLSNYRRIEKFLVGDFFVDFSSVFGDFRGERRAGFSEASRVEFHVLQFQDVAIHRRGDCYEIRGNNVLRSVGEDAWWRCTRRVYAHTGPRWQTNPCVISGDRKARGDKSTAA